MKHRIRSVLGLTASLVGLAACAQVPQVYPAGGQEMGRVISTVPVYQQVSVPRQVCSNEQVVVSGQPSGAGAIMGGIAGGAVGNAIGSGSGRAVATAIGLMGGAILGNNIERTGPDQVQNVQRCQTQTTYENQISGYNVTYEYGGKQYTMQMPQDPGAWVRLQVTPLPANSQPVYSPRSSIEVQPRATTVFSSETTYVVPPATTRYVYTPSVTYVDPVWTHHRHYNEHDRRIERADPRAQVWVQPAVSINAVPQPSYNRNRDDNRWR